MCAALAAADEARVEDPRAIYAAAGEGETIRVLDERVADAAVGPIQGFIDDQKYEPTLLQNMVCLS